MLVSCLFVGIGGFVGAVLRYLCTLLVPQPSFMWVTLGINVVGSFVLAVLVGLVARGILADENVSLMLRVGLCGGFTAFGAMVVEATRLVEQGQAGVAVFYMVLSCTLGVLAAFAGTWVTRP